MLKLTNFLFWLIFHAQETLEQFSLSTFLKDTKHKIAARQQKVFYTFLFDTTNQSSEFVIVQLRRTYSYCMRPTFASS